MVYDGHAYCFPDQRGDGGFADPDEFRRHLQLGMAGHFQPAWRVRDRAPADSSGLADLSRGLTFDAIKDAQFLPAGHGRFEWTVDGERYAKQVMPASVVDMSYSPESLVAEMDYAGVDWALLHRTPYLGIGNDFISGCVRRFPDRIHGLAHVEEWLVQPEPEASVRKLERAVGELGLSGLQFLPNFLRLYEQTEAWDSAGFLPFWDAVAGLRIPVFFSLGGWVGTRHSRLSSDAEKLESYLAELRTLRRWMQRYPDVKVVLTHGFAWRLFVDGDTLSMPDVVLETAPIDSPNFHVQLLFAVLLGGVWDYPMPQMRPVLEKMARRIGADRLIWGTDIPMVMRHYTYRQSLDSIRLYCDFLGTREMDMILGGNMARLMGIEAA
jgi:predicted TIM-barrel fold metal-dependent hydrolase